MLGFAHSSGFLIFSLLLYLTKAGLYDSLPLIAADANQKILSFEKTGLIVAFIYFLKIRRTIVVKACIAAAARFKDKYFIKETVASALKTAWIIGREGVKLKFNHFKWLARKPREASNRIQDESPC